MGIVQRIYDFQLGGSAAAAQAYAGGFAVLHRDVAQGFAQAQQQRCAANDDRGRKGRARGIFNAENIGARLHRRGVFFFAVPRSFGQGQQHHGVGGGEIDAAVLRPGGAGEKKFLAGRGEAHAPVQPVQMADAVGKIAVGPVTVAGGAGGGPGRRACRRDEIRPEGVEKVGPGHKLAVHNEVRNTGFLRE